MIRLGNLRVMARDARIRHEDPELGELLDQLADNRSVAIREQLGGPGWLTAAEVPDGTVFVAAARPRGVRYRREGEMVRSMLPYGTGRLCSPANVDVANEADHAGYVADRP